MLSTRLRMGFWLILAGALLLQVGHLSPQGGFELTRFTSLNRPVFDQEAAFTFAVTADMRAFTGPGLYDTPGYFRGAVEGIRSVGTPAFMLTLGDLDPVQDAEWTVQQAFGADFGWYPLVGNHELPGQGVEASLGENLARLQEYPVGGVLPGPAGCPTTTHSFDYRNAHFVILNQYCDSGGADVTDGDISDHLYDWLSRDLARTQKPFIFVAGHEPAFPLPDADNGRLRHEMDSLNQFKANRNRFWTLLKQHSAIYLCGHTHNYSAARIDGVWQVDAGHARGLGDAGADSTFLLITVSDQLVLLEAYRSPPYTPGRYFLRHIEPLFAAHTSYLPGIQN
jgi:predicted phosphodiesterase